MDIVVGGLNMIDDSSHKIKHNRGSNHAFPLLPDDTLSLLLRHHHHDIGVVGFWGDVGGAHHNLGEGGRVDGGIKIDVAMIIMTITQYKDNAIVIICDIWIE